MAFELFVALRYLLARRKQAFISLISLISTLGVAVGVMALVIALGADDGACRESCATGSSARRRTCTCGRQVASRTTARRSPRFAPSRALLAPGPPSSGRRSSRPHEPTRSSVSRVLIRPSRPASTDIQRAMQSGSIEALAPVSEEELPGILIGRNLAEQLGVGTGDTGNVAFAAGHLVAHGHDSTDASRACRGRLHAGAIRVRRGVRIRFARVRRAVAGQGGSRSHRVTGRRTSTRRLASRNASQPSLASST